VCEAGNGFSGHWHAVPQILVRVYERESGEKKTEKGCLTCVLVCCVWVCLWVCAHTYAHARVWTLCRMNNTKCKHVNVTRR